MAPRDIPVGSKYATVINHAILDAKAVVLIFSEHSAVSPWVESEINIAFSNRIPIIPYKIDNSELSNYDEFYLMLNNRHWIDAYPDFRSRFAELVAVVRAMVGASTPKSSSAEEKTKIYQIGDYYNENGKRGVVFEVWDGGRHGKIVSLDETRAAWDTRVDRDDDGWKNGTRTYADSKSDGKANTDKIMARSDSKYFEAFAWCRAKGSSWYLPSRNELTSIFNNKSTLDDTLQKYGTALNSVYWTSMECVYYKPEFCAWYVSIYNGNTRYLYKGFYNYVRAVSAF